MSMNPINLAVRFLLELLGLAAMATWGWATHEGAARVVLAVGVPLIAAAVWGVFRVPNEPGKPPVTVPGIVRLLLEAIYFGGAVALLVDAGHPTAALVFGVVIVLHYLASYDRIIRLLKPG